MASQSIEPDPARFIRAMRGESVDRLPVLPKIWVAGACQLTGADPASICGDPAAIMDVVPRATRLAQADAARLFLFPHRSVGRRANEWVEIDDAGQPRGKIDLEGGWATLLDKPDAFDVENPACMAFNHYYPANAEPHVHDVAHARRIAVPTASFFEQAGYGAMIQQTFERHGDRMALIGDCDTPSLSFMATLRGMQRVMIDLLSETALAEAIIEKGTAIAVERARFWLARGIRVLRINDSMANMSVISPDHWREFVAPAFREFCHQVHALDPEALIYCHICGNVMPVLEELAQTGLDCIGPLDPMGGMSVSTVRELIGQEIALMGGINTMTLLQGPISAIHDETRQCIEANASDTGYIPGSGCVVPPHAPLEHLKALYDAACEAADGAT